MINKNYNVESRARQKTIYLSQLHFCGNLFVSFFFGIVLIYFIAQYPL